MYRHNTNIAKRTLDQTGSIPGWSVKSNGFPKNRCFWDTKFVLYRHNTNIAKRKIELVKDKKKRA